MTALVSAPSYLPSIFSPALWEVSWPEEAAGKSAAPVAFPAEVEEISDGWIAASLGQIARFRSYQDGWDGTQALAPTRKSIQSAEYLTAFFAEWPLVRRPSLAVDCDGRPTFAAKCGDFYLHLAVEPSGKLTWYAVAGGTEYFRDDIPFDGTSLPSDLAKFAA